MGCCIAIAFVISLLRKAWFAALPGRRPEPVLFAPPARRPAPGATIPVAPESAPPTSTGRLLPMFLGAFALTGMVYMASVFALTRLGITAPDAATLGWTARNVVLAGLILLALVGAAVTFDGVPRASFAAVLTGAGAAWLGFGLLDMHGFAVVSLARHGAGCACCCTSAHGSLLADLAFHGVGLVALVAGAGLLANRRRVAA